MMYGNLILLVIIGVVIYMMTKGGGGCCGGHDQHGGHRDHEGHGESGNQNNGSHTRRHMEADASQSSHETDPVCGMEVSGGKIESSHLGKTFHFCSEQCQKVFNLNPGKYDGA